MEFSSVRPLGFGDIDYCEATTSRVKDKACACPDYFEKPNIDDYVKSQDELLSSLECVASANRPFVKHPTEQEIQPKYVSDPLFDDKFRKNVIEEIIEKKSRNNPEFPVDDEFEYTPVQQQILDKLTRGEGITLEEAVLLSGTSFEDFSTFSD